MRKHAKLARGVGGHAPPEKNCNFDGCRLPLRLLLVTFGLIILAKIF